MSKCWRDTQASALLPDISSMTPRLNAKSLLSFKLTGVSRSQQDQSILLAERSSRGGGVTIPLGARGSPRGGFPYQIFYGCYPGSHRCIFFSTLPRTKPIEIDSKVPIKICGNDVPFGAFVPGIPSRGEHHEGRSTDREFSHYLASG